MSKFHASIRDLLQDVHSFLSSSMKNEVLSSSCLTQREKLLIQLLNFNREYPELLLQFSDGDQNASNQTDSIRHPPSSPVPYVDMNGGSPYKIPSFFPNSDDISYDIPITRDKLENRSIAESDDYFSDDAKSLPYVSASELASSEKTGYLDKKKRESIKGWLNPFQRRWCAIKDGVLYYYEKNSDRKQRGSISLAGYEVRTISEDANDAKKHSHCFELVCPGKRTYQFSASSEKELHQWISTIETSSKVAYPSKSSNEDTSRIANNHQSPNKNEDLVDDCEDIYETVLEESDQPEESEDNVPKTAIEEEEYSDVDTALTQNQVINYSEWYVGLWDCTSDDVTELSFLRGDLIRVINKDYDRYAWWLGELNGKVGFVPKSYLMQAYESY